MHDYTWQAYTSYAKTFVNVRKKTFWEEIDYLISYLYRVAKKEYPRILDIGCGGGRLLEYIKKYFVHFWYVWIDFSPGMIIEARKEYPYECFWEEDMRQNIAFSHMDAICFIASFHHLQSFEERKRVLQRSYDLLKNEGYILMTNWNLIKCNKSFLHSSNIHEIGEENFWSKNFSIKIGACFRWYHGFSLEELEHLFSLTGFKLVENRIFSWEKNIVTIARKNLLFPPR